MNSFETKIRGKMMRKRENKNYNFVPFYPTHNRNFQKNCQKIQKIKKYHYGVHLKPKQVGKGLEKQKIKIIVPFRSYPTRNRKFQKKSNEIQKIKKYYYGII